MHLHGSDWTEDELKIIAMAAEGIIKHKRQYSEVISKLRQTCMKHRSWEAIRSALKRHVKKLHPGDRQAAD